MKYLATPYSHKDPNIMIQRFNAACHAAAVLMGDGETVFSPIAHSHPIALYMGGGAQVNGEFWMKQDSPILDFCDELVIIMMDGWETSNGIKKERDYAAKHCIKISYMDPLTLKRVDYQG